MTLTPPKSTICGVQVATWGTHEHGGNGMPHFLDQKFFGGNTGHASISITFPADEKGRELIKKYCSNPPIPFEKHSVNQEEVYVVNFSWWGSSAGPYQIAPHVNEDNIDERQGHHVEWDPKWKAYIQPEERYHGGSLSRTKVTYDTATIVHQRGLNQTQIDLMNAEARLQLLEQRLKSVDVLKGKLKDKESTLKKLKTRRDVIKTKSESLKIHQEQIAVLNKLKAAQSKKVTSLAPLFNEKEIALLDTLDPKWNETPINDDGRKIKIQEIEKKRAQIKQQIKILHLEKPTKLAQDEARAKRFSETEIMLLNKFMPDWKTKYSIDGLTPEELTAKMPEIRQELKEMKIREKKEISKINKSIKLLKTDLENPEVAAYLSNVKKYNELKRLKHYFSSYVKEGHSHHLMEDEEMEISGRLKKKLHKFKSLTNNEWKDGYVLPNEKGEYKYMDRDAAIKITEKIKEDMKTLKSSIEKQIDESPDCLYKKYEGEYYNWKDLYVELRKLTDKRFDDYLTRGETTDMDEDLQVALKKVFQSIEKSRFDFLHSKDSISREEADTLMAFATKNMVEAKARMVDIQPSLGTFLQGDFENFLTRGHPPDDLVKLPLDHSFASAVGTEDGMNVESMLKQIKHLAETETFDLHTTNCSYTVSTILEAGAANDHLKGKYQNRALGTIANPQMVANNARDYLLALKSPKDSRIKKIMRWNPLERLGGWCFDKLFVDDEATKAQKAAAIAVGIPVGIYAGVKIGITKLMNPLKSFNELISFAKYANSKKHIGFKIVAGVAYVPAIILTAPFAGVQYTISKAIDLFAGGFNALFGKKPLVHPSDNIDLSKEDIKLQALFSNVSKSVLSRITTIELQATSLEEARNKAHDEHQYYISLSQLPLPLAKEFTLPILKLSDETKKNIESEIAKEPDTEKRKKRQADYNDLLKKDEDILRLINNLVKRSFDYAKQHPGTVQPVTEVKAAPIDVEKYREAANLSAEQARQEWSQREEPNPAHPLDKKSSDDHRAPAVTSLLVEKEKASHEQRHAAEAKKDSSLASTETSTIKPPHRERG